jgi:hypothetical protein
MPKPISFKYANKTLVGQAGVEDGIRPLPVWTNGHLCISRWEFSFTERLSILFRGKLWVSLMSGQTQPPIALDTMENLLVPTIAGVKEQETDI